MEYNQVKIPTFNQEEFNQLDNRKYTPLNSNSKNTKNTSNIIISNNLSNSQTKKDLKNNLNNIYFLNSDKLNNDLNKKKTPI